MTSIAPTAPSIAPTALLSVVPMICTLCSDKPAWVSPARIAFANKAAVCAESDPPRNIAALPDLIHKPAASTVTLGRDS